MTFHVNYDPQLLEEIVGLEIRRREEREAEMLFGEVYARYLASVPMFFPRIRRRRPGEAQEAEGAVG